MPHRAGPGAINYSECSYRGRRFQMVDQECAFGAQGHKIWVCTLEVTGALGSPDVCLGLQGEFLKIILQESLTGTMISI